jgi:hypothetical protein
MSFFRASSYSSWRVCGVDAPVRRRRAVAAPCFPRAVRVFFGMLLIVRFDSAALRAFLMFRFAACRCFVVAMSILLCVGMARAHRPTIDRAHDASFAARPSGRQATRTR